MGPGAAVIIFTPFFIVAIALLYIFRRERLRGPTSTTHPFLIGLYRELASILFLFVMYLLLAPFLLPRHQ